MTENKDDCAPAHGNDHGQHDRAGDSADIESVLDQWFVFGPADASVEE